MSTTNQGPPGPHEVVEGILIPNKNDFPITFHFDQKWITCAESRLDQGRHRQRDLVLTGDTCPAPSSGQSWFSFVSHK